MAPTRRSQPALSIRLEMHTAEVRPPLRRFLPRELRRLALLAGVRRGQLGVAVVDAAEMARLHQRYLGLRSATDVLTFDLRGNPGESPGDVPGAELDGDLVICLPVAVKQSALRGHAARLEVLLYALHGLLHLLGYDDHRPAAAARMHAREDQLLRRAGHGPVFARPPHVQPRFGEPRVPHRASPTRA
jgi:probable rRNA maturation factor